MNIYIYYLAFFLLQTADVAEHGLATHQRIIDKKLHNEFPVLFFRTCTVVCVLMMNVTDYRNVQT